MERNFYATLGLSRTAAETDITASLDRELSKASNLSRIPTRQAETEARRQALQLISQTLLNPATRSMYVRGGQGEQAADWLFCSGEDIRCCGTSVGEVGPRVLQRMRPAFAELSKVLCRLRKWFRTRPDGCHGGPSDAKKCFVSRLRTCSVSGPEPLQ